MPERKQMKMRNKLYKKMCLKYKILNTSYLELKADLLNFTSYNMEGINSRHSKLFKYVIIYLK